ncbi:hypothetical protein EUX98_g6671 [Antrodiella citrinella]|uniref:Zn(2)-C6 fungal-type domain-containing protein n=1 Tax=Antrodiella citrinella TaxID=2447956 RepID=A0A4S4MQ81_9APHY|nr:hypothetical protein EUX98_g6671 [Antrodiella citrinella]
MTVGRELSSDGQVPFIATSILHGFASSDRKPVLSRLSTGEALKIIEPRLVDHSAPPASGSGMATMSPIPAAEPSVDDGASWNLVPYDVPWGQDYYQYKQGTLPGPDGACLFLRSPTPVEKRRTLQACKMCRERKAKCSGDKPNCTRCLARGYLCQYIPDTKKIRPAKAGPLRLKGSRSLSHPYQRRDSDSLSVASSTDFSEYSSYSSASSSASYFSPKEEELEFPPAVLLSQLQYPEEEDVSKDVVKNMVPHPRGAYLPPYEYTPSQDYHVHERPPLSATSTTSSLSFWSGYESPRPAAQTLAPIPIPSFHAPRPLRYSQSLPFLPSSERRVPCPADVINRPRSAEPAVETVVATTVDPRVLTQQPGNPVYHAAQEVAPEEYVAEQMHPWHMQNAPTDHSAAMQEGALLMQQYCNISPVTPYAQSHPVEAPSYQHVEPHQVHVQYHVAIPQQMQLQYPQPSSGTYGFPSFVVASPSFV